MDLKQESDRRNVLKRLRNTKRNETVCLMGWEVEILTAWIDEMRERILKNEEVQKADC